MRLVLDTNVLIAAFVSRGHCHELLEHLVRAHELITSEFILDEVADVLAGKFGVPARVVTAAVELHRSRTTIVVPTELAARVSRDPDDDRILGTALTADADCLVTGDSDLLVLESYEGIPIVRPADFWAFEVERTGTD